MAKGAMFERSICTKLSEWWTADDEDGPRDDVFWRTSQSGGRATTRAKKGRKTAGQAGDICATDPIGQPLIDTFALELKRGYNKTLCLIDCIDNTDTNAEPVFKQWIDQAIRSQRQANAAAYMIIFKRDRRREMVLYPSWVENYKSDLICRPVVMAEFETGESYQRVVIRPLEEFLKGFNKKTVIRIMKAAGK